MKVYHSLLPLLAATTMFAGCELGKGDAQAVLRQATASVEKVRPEAQANAPEQLKPVEATLADMQQKYDRGEYKAVKQEVPQINEQYKTLVDAMTAKQAENLATIDEWGELNKEVPKSVDAVQARVDSLKPNALPKGVTREELESAKTDLAAAKQTWDEATKAADAGNPAEARDKAKIVQAKMDELKSSLAMEEQVASNATPAASAPSAQ